MSKVSVSIVLLAAFVVVAKSQYFGGPPAGFGPPMGINFQEIALQSALGKLATTDLPQDLRERADQIALDSQTAFEPCDMVVIYWQSIKCRAFQLRTIMMQIAAIQTEAANRTTTVAPVTEAIVA